MLGEFALNKSKKLSLLWMHVFTVLCDFDVLHGHVSTFIHGWNTSADVIRRSKDSFKLLAEFSRGGEAKGLLENGGDQGKKKEDSSETLIHSGTHVTSDAFSNHAPINALFSSTLSSYWLHFSLGSAIL